MSAPAGVQLDRLVALVAELSRRSARGEADATVAELAERFGVSPRQIRRDVVALTTVSGDAEAEWLSSLSVMLEGDRLAISSQGPFRRPVRFSPLELAAMQVGLADEAGAGDGISGEVAALLSAATGTGEALRVLPQPSDGEARIVRLALDAVDRRQVLAIKYTGAGDRTGAVRHVEPRDVAYDQGRYYIVAWCRMAGDWRTFRADRVLDASIEAEESPPRAGAPPDLAAGGVFHAADEPDAVEVRFAPSIARWIRERYPDARDDGDGSVVVTYRVADPHWLVQTVLQYGADAEVVGPPAYRDIVARALGDG